MVSMSLKGSTSLGSGAMLLSKSKDVGAQVYCNLESVRRRRGFWSVSGKCIERFGCVDSVSSAGALASVIMLSKMSGAFATSCCARLSLSAAITYPSYFLGFNCLDERVVAAEGLPGIGVKAVFFPYAAFGKKPSA